MAIDAEQIKKVTKRLEVENNIWLATVRPDGRPHLIPIWFVWFDGRVWISTPRDTQKVKNIQKNPSVTISLEDGTNPVIFEGMATLHDDAPWPDVLGPHFKKKYDWDFRTDDTANYVLVEIMPTRMISWT